MLSSKQVEKYVELIHASESIADAHSDIRHDLGRDLTTEEFAQIAAYQKNGGSEAQIEVICRNDINATASTPINFPDTISEAEPVDNVTRMQELAAQIAETYRRKNADYGDSFGISVRKYGIIAALTRMSDKWNRLENLILNREKGNVGYVADESVLDTLCDMATYCLMTVMEIEKGV